MVVFEILTNPSHLRPVIVVREQLHRVPPADKSRPCHLPTAIARAAQVRSRRPNKWRGPYIRCYKDGGSECHRGAQLAPLLHRAEQ